MSSKPKLHLIGNAHLDPVWLWPWTEGFHEAKATFRSALDRMQEYDDERPFIFVASSAAYYEWIEQSDPAMFREIQQRVREGRWGLVGGWWIQPDCNIPCGESFVRQALVGQRYFQEKFGVMATVGYNVDSFGHNGMLPQILLKSGLSNYVFMRPGPSEKGLPGRLFWWEADDGSRVLAFRIPFSYATWGSDMENAVRLTAGEFQPPLDLGMFFYGVGNHGGGPTKENIESLRRLQEQPDFPELVFSTPAAFFAEARAKQLSLPVVHDDLQHHASGCYAAHSGVKRWNRQAENRLMSAEKWSALAWRISGQPYPADFNHAWKNVLFNQFHDIMAGGGKAQVFRAFLAKPPTSTPWSSSGRLKRPARTGSRPPPRSLRQCEANRRHEKLVGRALPPPSANWGKTSAAANAAHIDAHALRHGKPRRSARDRRHP